MTGLAVLLHRLAKLPAYPSSFGAWVLALTAEAVARDLQALAHDLRGSQWTAVPARIIGGRAALILAAGELLLAAGVRPGGDDA